MISWVHGKVYGNLMDPPRVQRPTVIKSNEIKSMNQYHYIKSNESIKSNRNESNQTNESIQIKSNQISTINQSLDGSINQSINKSNQWMNHIRSTQIKSIKWHQISKINQQFKETEHSHPQPPYQALLGLIGNIISKLQNAIESDSVRCGMYHTRFWGTIVELTQFLNLCI